MSSDPKSAAALAREGFDLWQSGKLDEALLKYVAALDVADPNHHSLSDYHGEFAAVLATLGRDAEALEQYQISLTHELRQDPEGSGAGVAMARYFLGEQLLKMKQPERALHVMVQGLSRAGQSEWVLRIVEARALWELGRRMESKRSAQLAVLHAPSEKKATDLRIDLAEMLDG